MRFPWGKWLSRRPAAEPPDKPWLDPRWERLNTIGVTCASCGQLHKGVFDIAFGAPGSWAGEESYEPNAAVLDALSTGKDILTEDFCIMGEHRFLRCVLPFPIIGTRATFSFGIWGSIKPEYFEDVLDEFDAGRQAHLGSYFTWISNILPGCDPMPLKGTMVMRDGRLRPVINILDEDNRYAVMQRLGMSIAELFDIYARCGHHFEPIKH